MNIRQDAKFTSVTITLRPLKCPGDHPTWSGYRRLRALLKIALRSLSLRCERLEFDGESSCHDNNLNDQGGRADE